MCLVAGVFSEEASASMLTLVEEDVQVSPLRQTEALHEALVLILNPLAHSGQLLLGEQPVFPLSRFPVVGRHLGGPRLCCARLTARCRSVKVGGARKWDFKVVADEAEADEETLVIGVSVPESATGEAGIDRP